jgi:membrane-bound lytic murein transglycosylase D
MSLGGMLLLVLLSGAVQAGEEGEGRGSSQRHFPYPAGLKPQVEFWKKVFAGYSKYQVVIHDTKYLDKVYKVLDFRLLIAAGEDEAEVERIRSKNARQELERIRVILVKLHRAGPDPANLNPEEQRIWNLYRDVKDRDKFLAAAQEDRLRCQIGLRERFAEGIEVSRRYLDEMENIFRREGLPVELTRLPLIESSFNLKAYSKAGAAGIWQFIPSTGRLYMRVDGTLDERRDPLTSTAAAAKLLKENYEMLGTWPLAITAYNHGPFGVFKATQVLDTRDIVQIIRRYRSPSFGFASKNFYAEFLAALEVEKDYEKHFGPLRLEPPLRYEAIRIQDFVSLGDLAHCANTDVDRLLALNPAFEGAISAGRAYVPRGYRVRLPVDSLASFHQRYAALADGRKANTQKVALRTAHAKKADVRNAAFRTHKVRRGQTLEKIARQYGTTVTRLKKVNGLRNVKQLKAGQVLRVPT